MTEKCRNVSLAQFSDLNRISVFSWCAGLSITPHYSKLETKSHGQRHPLKAAIILSGVIFLF